MAAAKKATAKKADEALTIPGVKRETVELWLIGDSPLILHQWSPEARGEMLRKQMKLPTQGKKAKNPTQCVAESFYLSADGSRYVFPSRAIKKAAVSACRFVDAKMTEAKGMFFVLGDDCVIHGEQPVGREDMVRVGMGTADIRYRGCFMDWAIPITIEFNGAFVRPAQIVNLFENAGFGVGIGEWRPEKNGPYGRFHVAKADEAKRFYDMIPEVRTIEIEPFADAAE